MIYWQSWSTCIFRNSCASTESSAYIDGDCVMPPISMKKVLVLILLVLLLFHWRFVADLCRHIGQIIYDSFEPLRNRPVEERYVVVLLLLALIYATLFRLLHRKK